MGRENGTVHYETVIIGFVEMVLKKRLEAARRGVRGWVYSTSLTLLVLYCTVVLL